jgi:hypothetical protein
MIVLIEQSGERAVFKNVAAIQTVEKRSIATVGGKREVINLLRGDGSIIPGGDGIDLGEVKVTPLPNPEQE